MQTKVNIILSLLAFSVCNLLAQVSPQDTLPLFAPPILPDSGFQIPDSRFPPTLPDTIGRPLPPPSSSSINWDSIKVSSNGIEEQVDYKSRDSMFFDLKNKQIHLWGDAEVKYQTMTITADYMVIDWNENIVTAEGRTGPLGETIGKPKFVDGAQQFTASKLRYNFKSYKGIIYNAQTQQEGMNIVGEKGKIIGNGGDTTRANVIYNRNAIFSTCELEHPHFGIRSNKQKIVQDKVAVVGPSNIVIGDIPTPIWLPFGFFPLKIGKKTGLIFPQDYEYSEAFGFGLEGIGWFLPINDHFDLKLTGDIYFKGTFRIHAASTYRKRYKYNGNVNLDLAYLRSENLGVPFFEPTANIRWSHTQDTKAHPYRNLGGSINLQTGNYQQRNLTDAQSVLQSSLSSNMNYRQRFDAPFDLTASFVHSQNTKTRDVTISFPTINFQTQNIFPFKRKLQTGGERWYERIQFRYNSEARNQFTAKDTTLFTQKTLDDAKFGVRHNVTAGTSFNILKYFTFSPNASYKEVWYFKTVNKTFDPTPEITLDTIYNSVDSMEFVVVPDTTKFGTVIDMEKFGFKPLRQYNFGMSMSTKIFGTILFKRGRLKGLRHVMTPSFGFNFTPDYTNPDWGYFKTVRTDLRSDEESLYNIFENNRIGGFDTPSAGGRQMALSYGLSNLFEAKIATKNDTTGKDKKIPLFRSINVSGNYNFAADSLKWSVVNVGGNTSFFNNISTFRFGIIFDPYERTEQGKRINKLYWQDSKRPLRLVEYNLGFQTNLTVGRIRDLIKGVNTDVRVANQPRDEDGQLSGPEEQDLLSIFENFSINHNFALRRAYNVTLKKDTLVISANSITSQGSIKLTDNWNVRVGNFGYDFQAKRITYPDFGFYRDLHCWQMGFDWQPNYGTYSFFLRVKPGKLDFINVPYRKNIQDRGAGF